MSQPQRRSLTGWLNGLGAVLIVAGVIGVSLALASSSQAASATLGGWGPWGQFTRAAERDGLSVVMTITPGPYFVGELLEADMSLTDSSSTTYSLSESCGGALWATTSGGTSPRYSLPALPYPDCPFINTSLTSGQTLTVHAVLPLLRSGNVILQSHADFLQNQMDPDGVEGTIPGPSPLDGYWPSFRLSVASTVPPDRRISLQRLGTAIHVSVPLAARTHLYAETFMDCSDPLSNSQGVSGMLIGGAGWWGPLSQPLLQEPACELPDHLYVRWATVQWIYAISAPGFAIASGELTQAG